MRCLYCRKRIGFLRRLTDREFCCRDHRKAIRTTSARAVRNSHDGEDMGEIWPVYLRTIDEIAEGKNPQPNLANTATFGIVIVVALAIGSMGLLGPGSAHLQTSDGPMDDVRRLIKNHAAIRLNENFQAGLKAWKGFASATTSDWSFNHGFVQPGRLRLWKDSLGMNDYQMEFVSQIEKKGFGWAYRATDNSNFYATKIQIVKPGPLPSADLLRYAVIRGQESNRVSLPLPMVIRNDTLYRVQLTVKGENFTTSVNGQVVDTWSDNRLKSGGVGFFTDRGEAASLRWVTVTNRDNFVGRILSYLGFWVPIEPVVWVGVLPRLP